MDSVQTAAILPLRAKRLAQSRDQIDTKFLENVHVEAHVLNAEIGAGARQSERADGVDENDFILDGGLHYQWTFSETANFTRDFAVEYGELNTYLESVSAVTARLIGQLALVASYTIKKNSDVPVGTEKTDTFSALALEYKF